MLNKKLKIHIKTNENKQKQSSAGGGAKLNNPQKSQNPSFNPTTCSKSKSASFNLIFVFHLSYVIPLETLVIFKP